MALPRLLRRGCLLWVPLAVLFAVDRVWQCAHLHSIVVAVLLLQRALRARTAAGVRCISRTLLARFLAIFRRRPRKKIVVWSVLALLVAASYLSIYADVPITLKEAQVNARTRMILEDALARFLVHLPPSATILMYQGEHVGALQEAGIPLRHVISEVSHPDWEWALLDPARHADYHHRLQGRPGVDGGARTPAGFDGAVRNHCARTGQVLDLSFEPASCVPVDT